MSPPAPFRDHERWVAYNQYLMGAFVLGVFAFMITAGGWWHMTSGIVVEEAETASGDVGFAVDFTGALFEGAGLVVVGLTLYHFTWLLYDRAKRQRRFARGQRVAAVAISTMIATAVLDVLTDAERRSEVSEE